MTSFLRRNVIKTQQQFIEKIAAARSAASLRACRSNPGSISAQAPTSKPRHMAPDRESLIFIDTLDPFQRLEDTIPAAESPEFLKPLATFPGWDSEDGDLR